MSLMSCSVITKRASPASSVNTESFIISLLSCLIRMGMLSSYGTLSKCSDNVRKAFAFHLQNAQVSATRRRRIVECQRNGDFRDSSKAYREF